MTNRIRPAVRKLIGCADRIRSGQPAPVDCASIGVDAEYATLVVAQYAARTDEAASDAAREVAEELHHLVDDLLEKASRGGCDRFADCEHYDALERLIATALEIAWALTGDSSGSIPTWDQAPIREPELSSYGSADMRQEPLDQLFAAAPSDQREPVP